MVPEYKTYLAANILSEERVVTYRLLSRALNVHLNTAKQMLFEFHRQQNAKKPGTVHATYLIAGTKRNTITITNNGNTANNGEDEHMQSSPFRSSLVMPNQDVIIEDCPVLSITLVREEDLEILRSQYETITSIHIYSLAPDPLKDLQVLSDAAREATEIESAQDPLETARIYGTIINKDVRRRIGRRPLPSKPSAAAPAPVKPPSSSSKPANVEAKISSNPILNPFQTYKGISGKGSQEKRNASVNPPQIKRESSNIFKSFAKAKPPLKREGTDSSAGASGIDSAPLSGPEDEIMKDTSDDEEDDYVLPSQNRLEAPIDANRLSRKEREAGLKKMMEVNEDEKDEPDVIQEDLHPHSTKDITVSQSTEETVQVTGGRRRGRRRVMKKKTTYEEGYLVTREEPAWESFSEDEPVRSKSTAPSSQPPSSDKPKKGAGKAGQGQGNIMSFFGRRQ